MVAIPSHSMGPAPLIDLTVVDLFEPINFVDPNSQCKAGKGWGVVFVCTATPLLHVEMTQSYSTDSLTDGPEEVQGHAWGPEEVPVKSG